MSNLLFLNSRREKKIQKQKNLNLKNNVLCESISSHMELAIAKF